MNGTEENHAEIEDQNNTINKLDQTDSLIHKKRASSITRSLNESNHPILNLFIHKERLNYPI